MLDIKLKNRILSNSKLWNFMEKIVLILFIILAILLTQLVININSVKKSNSQIKIEKEHLLSIKENLKRIENYHNLNENLDWIEYLPWLDKCAKPSNLCIYKSTDNLKILSEKSQKELDAISKNFKIIEDNKDYSRIVKFIIIDKRKKTFITNDVNNIEFIKNRLSSFIQENGDFFNYVSSKGKWYNLSYDSTSSPSQNNFGENRLSEPQNFVEAYWFPKDYKYSNEDDALLTSMFKTVKENNNSEIVSWSSYISALKNKLKEDIIFIVVYSVLITILVIVLYLLGKERIIRGLKNCFVCRVHKLANTWFQSKSTFFKISIYTLCASSVLFIFGWAFTRYAYNWEILIISSPLLFIFLIFILPKMIKFSRYLDEIINGAHKITSGDLNHIIRETGDVRLSQLAHNVNKINKGFKVSIEDQIKNERLKSQLVANVSHDLKTPLTSIINSTDILLREDISEEEREDYLNILYRKSLKLKKLIDDLFQISKINSGKVQLSKENVDVVELVNQSIAEYSDTEIYNNKNLNFIIRPFKDNIEMILDGNKMSRVFENIINNTLKYSLKDTRVYVDIEPMENGIKIFFKNISSMPLDFDKAEIFERFTRGDVSRNSNIDGNGLGLAIAKSIVELHGGNMYVDFDGDLFKSIIELYY